MKQLKLVSSQQPVVSRPETVSVGVANEASLHAIPLSRAGEFELSEKEMKTFRARIYSLNKNNAAGRRWRTMRDGPVLMVWRIA